MLTFFLVALGVCLLVVSFALALARRDQRRRRALRDTHHRPTD